MLTSLASISHVTERAPVGFDSAPYFAALLASSWIAKANASLAFAKRVELGFELRVEHVPDHRHTGRPLRHAAEVRVAPSARLRDEEPSEQLVLPQATPNVALPNGPPTRHQILPSRNLPN